MGSSPFGAAPDLAVLRRRSPCRAIARSSRSARSATGLAGCDGWRARRGRTGPRPGPGQSASAGGTPRRAAYARQHRVDVAGLAVEAEQVAQVGERVAGVRELPVEHRRSRSASLGVEQQVLGVEVAVHQAGPRSTVSSRVWASTATSRSPSSSATERCARPGSSCRDVRRQVQVPGRDRQVGVDEASRRAASASRRGRPPARRARPTTRPGRPRPRVGSSSSPRTPVHARRDEHPGPVERLVAGRTSSTSGTGSRPRTSRSTAASISAPTPARVARAGRRGRRCAPPPPRPGTSAPTSRPRGARATEKSTPHSLPHVL